MPRTIKIRGTGETVELDDDDKVIRVVPSDKTVNVSGYDSRPTPTNAQMDSAAGAGNMRQTGERIADALPAVAGAAASPLGPLAEVGAAGATSYGVNNLQQFLSERYPGTVSQPSVDAVPQAITDMGLEAITGGASKAFGKLKSGALGESVASAAGKIAKPNKAAALDPEDMKLLESLGLDTSAGQQGGNSFLKSLEKRFGGQAYEDMRKRQERGLQSELMRVAGGDSSENALQGVSKQWADRLSNSRSEQRNAFQALVRSKDPVNLDLTTSQAKAISGRLSESSQLRTPLSKEAKAILEAFDPAPADVSKLEDRLAKLQADPKKVYPNNQETVALKDEIASLKKPKVNGPASMDAVLDIEDRMHRFISDPKSPERDKRLVESLMKSVDKDVRPQLGSKASTWDTYTLARKEQSDLFDGKEVGKILDSPYLEHNAVKKVIENPGTYAEARATAKNTKQFDAAVKEQFLSGVLEKSTDGSKFNLSQPIKELQANKEAYNRFFNAAERNNIDQLMRTMERVSPEAVDKGTVSMSLAQRGGLYLGGGLLASALPAGIISGMGGAGALALTGEVGARSFVKNVLLDPTNAKIVSQLAKTPPQSQQAKILTRQLFLGMKGAQVAIRQPEVGIIGWGTVNDHGQVVPNKDARSHEEN